MKTIFLFLFPALLFSGMKNPQVKLGECSVDVQDSHTVIQQKSKKSVIEWDEFSIASQKSASFQLPDAQSKVLNRVVGTLPSSIQGIIQSNGHVYLINPNGVVIGKEGVINCHSFLASALNITNEHFMNDKLLFEGDSQASIHNEGMILTQKNATLIANNLTNEGTIQAETLQLLAGSTVYLERIDDPSLIRVSGDGLIENYGNLNGNVIQLLSSGSSIDHLAINNDGLCQSYNIEEREGRILLIANGGTNRNLGKVETAGGQIQLLGDYIQLLDGAEITSISGEKGGEILIGGDFKGANPDIPNATMIYVGEDVSIRACASENGNGGKVIFWGDYLNYFFGSAEAKGAGPDGHGGLIEISSKGQLMFDGSVNASSPFGNKGTVLFDPIDVNIDNIANSNIMAGQLPAPPPMVPDPFTVTFIGSPAVINNVALGNALDVNNVIIDATQAGAGAGTVNFTFGANVTWSAANTLTVTTDRNIILGGNITSTGTGNFTALSLTANGTVAANYDGVLMQFGRAITTVDGDIVINATGGTTNGNGGFVMEAGGVQTTMQTTNGDITITGLSRASGVSAFSPAGGVEMLGRDAILSTTGNISLTGTNNSVGATHTRGIQIDSGGNVGADRTRVVSGSGTINIDGTVTDPVSGFPSGVRVFRGSLVQTTSSDITISGNSRDLGVIVSNSNSEVVSSTGNINISAIVPNATSFGAYSQSNGSLVRTTGGGNVTITGQAAAGGSDIDITAGGTDTIGAAGTGDITLNFDTITFGGTDTDVFEGSPTSSINIIPRTLTNDIGIGGAAGTFIPDPVIARLINGFDTVVVGATNQNSTTNIQNWPITDISSGLPVIKNLTLRNNIVNIGPNVDMNNQDLAVIIGTSGAGGTFNLNNDITNGGGTNTVTGIGGNPENNIFNAANNTINTWNITANDAGDYNSTTGGFSFDFTNVGTTIGGSMDDTFVISDGVQMSGQIDGGAPPTGNVLDYSAWTTDPMVTFTGPFSGNALNLNTSGAFADGFQNFENVISPFSGGTAGAAVVQTILAIQNTFPAAINLNHENLYRLYQQWLYGVLNDYYLYGLIYGLVINGDVDYQKNRLFDSSQYQIVERIRGLTKDIQAYSYLIFQKEH